MRETLEADVKLLREQIRDSDQKRMLPLNFHQPISSPVCNATVLKACPMPNFRDELGSF